MPWNHTQFDDETGRAAKEVPSIVHDANFTLPISIEGAPSIDEAIRLTIADMSNALRLLENS